MSAEGALFPDLAPAPSAETAEQGDLFDTSGLIRKCPVCSRAKGCKCKARGWSAPSLFDPQPESE